MSIFLTTIFFCAWLINLSTRVDNWNNVFWWGLLIILCGIWFSLDKIEQITHNGRR